MNGSTGIDANSAGVFAELGYTPANCSTDFISFGGNTRHVQSIFGDHGFHLSVVNLVPPPLQFFDNSSKVFF